jgi:hypothetical protein
MSVSSITDAGAGFVLGLIVLPIAAGGLLWGIVRGICLATRLLDAIAGAML